MTAQLNRARSWITTLSLVICVSSALTGCKSDGDDSASSTSAPASVPTASPAPGEGSTPPTVANKAPSIAGTASVSAKVSTPYSFAPAASDPDGDQLSFQIKNKPAWATFSTVTGQLSGTPSTPGTHTDILITATDGKASASLSAFSITVTTMSVQPAATTLTWTAPTQNTDGTSLTDLAGFVIAYGQSSAALTNTVKISNASVDTHVFEQLPSGTYYFAVKAYTSSGVESELSSTVSKIIG
jgi:hypothetical protein